MNVIATYTQHKSEALAAPPYVEPGDATQTMAQLRQYCCVGHVFVVLYSVAGTKRTTPPRHLMQFGCATNELLANMNQARVTSGTNEET